MTLEQEARLQELAKLKSGWMDGEGEPITEAAIDSARHVLDLYPGHVYPTLAGGIQIEGSNTRFDLEIVIEPDGQAKADLLDMKAFAEGIAAFERSGEGAELRADLRAMAYLPRCDE